MTDTSLSKGFVVGSIAQYLGKRADDSATHEWTVFIRAANPDEDISTYVKRVNFVLHPTLQPPTRRARPALFESSPSQGAAMPPHSTLALSPRASDRERAVRGVREGVGRV